MHEALQILVDGDSCPVKAEVFKVAIRHQVPVSLVANSYMQIPNHPLFKQVIVGADFDAADNYIAANAGEITVVITADILLASRCLKVGATVLAPNGKPFTTNSIGSAIATRAIMEDLRAGGEQYGGPPPFSKIDRSRFLASLHEALIRLKRT